jgi:hypothetical protein
LRRFIFVLYPLLLKRGFIFLDWWFLLGKLKERGALFKQKCGDDQRKHYIFIFHEEFLDFTQTEGGAMRAGRRRRGARAIGAAAALLLLLPIGMLLAGLPAGGVPAPQRIVEVALSQVGNTDGEPYWSWFGFEYRVEWCACFVSWCAYRCGYIQSGLFPKYAGCTQGVSWFKGKGQWRQPGYAPCAGDIIFFDWQGDGVPDHTGIVEKYEEDTVYTIEGNAGNACRQRSYARTDAAIYGYGAPAYARALG